MSLLVTVRIPHPLNEVQQIEKSHPEVMHSIMAAAMKYMTGHRRVERDGEVMDIDEFVEEADYRKFFGEAGEAIREYSELLGGGVHDVLWNTVADPPPLDERTED